MGAIAFLVTSYKALIICFILANIVLDVLYLNVRQKASESNPSFAPRIQATVAIVLSSMLLPCHLYASFVKPVIRVQIRYPVLLLIAVLLTVVSYMSTYGSTIPDDSDTSCAHIDNLCGLATAVNALVIALTVGIGWDGPISAVSQYEKILFDM